MGPRGGHRLALAWLTYSRGVWIPILSPFDLVIQEIGHVLFVWAPPLLMQMGGSIAWAAESLNSVAIYVADARDMLPPLVGDDGSGAGHDWHNILGTLDWLESTDAIANAVRTASVLLFIVAFGLAALGFMRARRA